MRKKRQEFARNNPVSAPRKYSILEKLLSGKIPKQVAFEESVTDGTVYLTKKCFPLFFWKKDD